MRIDDQSEADPFGARRLALLQLGDHSASEISVDWLLRDLAAGIAAREQRYERPVSRVTLSVWRADFDPATLRGAERPLRTFIYDVPREHAPR